MGTVHAPAKDSVLCTPAFRKYYAASCIPGNMRMWVARGKRDVVYIPMSQKELVA
jgi:hypothetical protein